MCEIVRKYNCKVQQLAGDWTRKRYKFYSNEYEEGEESLRPLPSSRCVIYGPSLHGSMWSVVVIGLKTYASISAHKASKRLSTVTLSVLLVVDIVPA